MIFSLLSFAVVCFGLSESARLLGRHCSSSASSLGAAFSGSQLLRFWVLFSLFHTLLPYIDYLFSFWFPFYWPLRLLLLVSLCFPGSAAPSALLHLLQPTLETISQRFHSACDSLHHYSLSVALSILCRSLLSVVFYLSLTESWRDSTLKEAQTMAEQTKQEIAKQRTAALKNSLRIPNVASNSISKTMQITGSMS
jgi:hypothetical protein